MRLDDFQRLTEQLGQSVNDLPGIKAQQLMMPMQRLKNIYQDLDAITDAKLSSVLILLYPHEGQIYIPLTRRHDYNGTHSGQISLPGGKVEDSDESRIHTALREAEEEIGVGTNDVQVIGSLSEIYIPPSNFKVLPVLGYVEQRPQLVPEESEVAEIIETPLHHLLNTDNYKSKDMDIRNGTLKGVPYFDVDGHVVWGATAMMLSEFVYLLNKLNQ